MSKFKSGKTMNLRETILKEHSKQNCDKIVNWVGNDQKRFDELVELFLNDEYRVIQRAAWPISCCVQKYPNLVKKHITTFLENLSGKDLHDAVKRNTIRLLQFINIPTKNHGMVIDLCFRYISSPSEPVAVKAFSLTVLDNLSKFYPDIRHELLLIIKESWDYETPAFKSRARKILKSST